MVPQQSAQTTSSKLVGLLDAAVLETVLLYLILIAGALLLVAVMALGQVRRQMTYREDSTATPDALISCPSCGARVPEADQSCETCGKPLDSDNSGAAAAPDDGEDDAEDDEWVEWGSVEQERDPATESN